MMVTTWVDFKQLKADVAIEQVVARYGVHLRRVGGTELRGRCPLPTHSSSRSRDSFAVNIARNVWSCRSLSCMQARGGRPGGNILDLVALMEGCSIRDAALRLQGWSGAAPARFIVPRASRPDPVASENPPLRFVLQYVDAAHPYLASRGVTPETVRTFGLGLYAGKGLLRGRMLSRHQADLLCTHFDRVLLMLDGDAAGRQGSAAIMRALPERLPVTAIALDDGMQPDGLAPGEIQHLVRSYFDESSTCAAGRAGGLS